MIKSIIFKLHLEPLSDEVVHDELVKGLSRDLDLPHLIHPAGEVMLVARLNNYK